MAKDRQVSICAESSNPNFCEDRSKMKKHKFTRSSLLLLALFLAVSLRALAGSTWYVNGVNGSDGNPCTSAGSACKTIGHAILKSSPGDSIIVAPATYTENLRIGFDLTIVGSNAWTTIIDGGHSATVVTISSATAHVNLSQMTMRNGAGLSLGGGGIYNLGTLTITNATISGNSSNDSVVAVGGLGGGIYNAGTLTIVQSAVSGNSVSRARLNASPYGGGVYNTGRLTIINSTIAANQAADYFPAGAPYGGGIANESGTLMISNSTLSNNSALMHTPLGTVSTYGGGIHNKANVHATFQNTIVANNTWGADCNGAVSSLGYNLNSDTTCSFNGPGDEKNINPKLGVLQNNTGPTQTMALLPGSPAMNAGNPSGCTDGAGHRLTIDQRGHSRPNVGACDIGAYNH